MRVHPAWDGTIDPHAVSLMLRYSYIPAPHSIYKGIYKLPPATVLSVPASGSPATAAPVRYWHAKDAFEAGSAAPFDGTDDAAIGELDTVLRRAVAAQMVADVPVGAFFSSGIDSSLVVSLMQAQSQTRVRTFTIGSFEKAYNEADGARRIARHLEPSTPSSL